MPGQAIMRRKFHPDSILGSKATSVFLPGLVLPGRGQKSVQMQMRGNIKMYISNDLVVS